MRNANVILICKRRTFTSSLIFFPDNSFPRFENYSSDGFIRRPNERTDVYTFVRLYVRFRQSNRRYIRPLEKKIILGLGMLSRCFSVLIVKTLYTRCRCCSVKYYTRQILHFPILLLFYLQNRALTNPPRDRKVAITFNCSKLYRGKHKHDKSHSPRALCNNVLQTRKQTA